MRQGSCISYNGKEELCVRQGSWISYNGKEELCVRQGSWIQEKKKTNKCVYVCLYVYVCVWGGGGGDVVQ